LLKTKETVAFWSHVSRSGRSYRWRACD